MARPKPIERKQIALRLSEAFVAQIDEVRGEASREAWMRTALTLHLRQGLGLPEPDETDSTHV